MEFRVLGSFEIWDGDTQVEVSGSKRRAVLALLVLHANEVVSSERLIAELWGDRPPQNAAASLRNHISRLRKTLGAGAVATRSWGYVLRADPEAVDLFRFEQLIRAAEPLPARARADQLREALTLWRGPPLDGLAAEETLAREAARLGELRLAVVEARVDADLEAGRDVQLIGELEALIAQHPLRERLRGQLILALYRSGRQAEALEVYRETRRLLTDELGLEPSPELRELERAILRHDPSLAVEREPLAQEILSGPHRRRWLVSAALAATAIVGAAAAFALTRSTPPKPVAARVAPARPLARHDRPRHLHVRRHVAAPRRVTTTLPPPPTQTILEVTRVVQQPATTATPPPHTTAAAPATTTIRRAPASFRVTDDFSSTSIDPSVWQEATMGNGVQLEQQDGQLEIAIPADATPDANSPWGDGIDGVYITRCAFSGNFDARIDFRLTSWPAGNGTVAGLDADFTGRPEHLSIDRGSNSGSTGDFYSFYAPTGRNRAVTTTDMSGGLRLVRTGDLVSAYVRTGSQWLPIQTTHYDGPVRISPILWVSAAHFGHADVAVAFDNFSVVAPPGTTGC